MKYPLMITSIIILVVLALLIISFFAFQADEADVDVPTAPDGTAFEVPTEGPPGAGLVLPAEKQQREGQGEGDPALE